MRATPVTGYFFDDEEFRPVGLTRQGTPTLSTNPETGDKNVWTCDYVVTAQNGDPTPFIPASFQEIIVEGATYDITREVDSGGTLTILVNNKEAAKACMGDKVKVTVTLAEGAMLESLSYVDKYGNSTDIDPNEAFDMPTSDITIKAKIKIIPKVTTISSEEDLRNLALGVNSGVYTYEKETVTLANNITLTGEWTPIGAVGETPEGTGPTGGIPANATPFKGTFDGKGKTISGLSITSGELGELGLFGYVVGGTVKNLTVTGSITSTAATNDKPSLAQNSEYKYLFDRASVGSVVAYGENVTISNCTSKVTIHAKYAHVGGILGIGTGSVTDCVNEGDITIVNHADKSGNASGDIYGTGGVGGIVGALILGRNGNTTALTVERCLNSGNMTADFGPSSTDSSQSTESSWSGKHMSGYFGGLVGQVSHDSRLTLTDSVNRGSIIGDMRMSGGLVGGLSYHTMTYLTEYMTVSNCYSIGQVRSTEKHDQKLWSGYMGGLIGNTNRHSGAYVGGKYDEYAPGIAAATVTNCYVSVKVIQDEPYAMYYEKYIGVRNDELWMGKADQSYSYGPTKIAELEAEGTTLFDTLDAASKTTTYDGKTVPVWQPDLTGKNGGYPLLYWEDVEVSDEEFTITFDISPKDANAKLTVTGYDGTVCTPNADGTYSLRQGAYTYTVTASGYKSVAASFIVSKDSVITVTLDASATVTFRVTPAEASFVLKSGDTAVTPDSTAEQNGVKLYTYTLKLGSTYNYDATASGYSSISRQFVPSTDNDGTTVDVTLTQSVETELDIYGDKNVDSDGNPLPHTIDEGGTYRIGDGATGIITINTSEKVVLVGGGIGTGSMYENLYIKYTTANANLTLWDVYISNRAAPANMIDFTGAGNVLTFAGTSILEQDTGASGYAMIHVGPTTTLTITGGTAYMYKNDQGAGIGGNGSGNVGTDGSAGQASENNGIINIEDATLFLKGTMQGAVIGTGSGATGGNAGTISITNSELNLIANARGSAIGGGAGSKAAAGSHVNITNSKVNINVNWSGAAIGGGGYDGGNDALGGTVTLSGTSAAIRAFIDENGIPAWGVSDKGVNGNKSVTAIVNGGQRLLEFDTSQLASSASTFTVKSDGTTIYSGGLFQWGYINEDVEKYGGGVVNVDYTIDNWVRINDPCLYLYLTPTGHELEVNGEKFTVTWDAASETFHTERVAVSTEGLFTTVIDGTTATTTLNSSVLADRLKEAGAGAMLSIEPNINTTVDKTVLSLTASDVKAMANSGVILHAGSPVAEITLSNAALKDLAAQGGSQVTLSAAQVTQGIYIEAAVDGKALTSVNDGLRITVPISNPTSSTILVVLNADGTQTVLDTTVGTDSVSAVVDGSCIIQVVDQAQHVYTTEVKNGVATTTFNSKLLAEYLETAGSGTQLDVVVEAPASITQSVVILSRSDAEAIINARGALQISSPLAGIALSRTALQDVAKQSSKEITISASQTKGGISIEVAADGKALEKISGGIQVTLPVSNPSQDTVLVLVNADGTETVLETTVGSNGVTATVGGSCVLKVVEKLKTMDVLATTEIEDGKATTTVDGEALAEALKEANANSQLVITVEVPEGEEITETTTQLTRGDVGAIAESEASLKVVTPLAEITLSNQALWNVAEQEGQEDDVVTITAALQENGTRIEIAADGQVLDKIDGGVKVSLPMAEEDLTPGSVLVVVDAQGKETVIKKSVAGEDCVTGLLDGSCTIKIVDNTKEFRDVAEDTWYADAVAFAGSHELFDGVGDSLFDPGGNMTRAMLVTVLYRLEDIPKTTAGQVFDDVASGLWYSDAICWASENNIVNGLSANIFAPDGCVTREQLATILYRYAGMLGLDVSARSSLGGFTDAGIISGWAEDAMEWAISTGLLAGRGGGILDPGSDTNRAEVATILQRFIHWMIEDNSSAAAGTGTETGTESETGTDGQHPIAVEDGVSTVTVDSAVLNRQLQSAAGEPVVITAEYPENTGQAAVVLTGSDVEAVVNAASALKIVTPLAEAVLSCEALQALAGQDGQTAETVTITATATAHGTTIEVAADGTALDKISGGLLITLPVEESMLTSGSVLVLVDEQGQETILKKSFVGEGGVTAVVNGSCTVKVVEGSKSYQDVSQDAWYSDAVNFASSHELFSGTGEGVFDPSGEMTRAMLVTVLHRLEDTPSAAEAEAFDDVVSDVWYTEAVLWASENNIVNGTEEGVFNPDGSVTREQLATILYRYAGVLGLDTSTGNSLSAFGDAGQISGWASDAMQWAVDAGLIGGKGGGILDPGGTATRAEVAIIFQRMVQLIAAR